MIEIKIDEAIVGMKDMVVLLVFIE